MEGLSIIIPVYNQIESTLKCINSIREFNKGSAYEIIVVDNGSTDETPQVFSSLPFNSPLTKGRESGSTSLEKGDAGGFPDDKNISYIRNEENLGVSKALNKGAGAAGYEVLCFMHNDVFIFKDNWAAIIYDFILNTPNTGMVGLYGAKTLRKDSSFRGKTIIHSIKDCSTISRPFEKVAIVDGLLMAIQKPVFDKIGGYCNDFSVHFYDKDISLKALKNGFDNYVLDIPFEHVCNTTRKDLKGDDMIRDEAQEKFVEMWSGYLPADVTTWREKFLYAVKVKRKKDS